MLEAIIEFLREECCVNSKMPDALRATDFMPYIEFARFCGRIRRVSVASDINEAHFTNYGSGYRRFISGVYPPHQPLSPIFLGERAFLRIWQNFQHHFEGRHRRVPSGVTTIGRLIRMDVAA